MRLVLTKKATTSPTSLTYDQAFAEAPSHGWIDGRLEKRDDTTFLRVFTPRKPQRSVVEAQHRDRRRLTAEGRMHEAGLGQAFGHR